MVTSLQKINEKKSLVIIKRGSYRDVYNRVVEGGSEYYHSEIFWHKFIEKLSIAYDITIISLNSNDEHNVLLPNQVRSIGVDLRKSLLNRIISYAKISHFLNRLNTYYLIIRNPEPVLLIFSLLQSKAMLPMFADSFNNADWKALLLAKLLKFTLSRKKIKYVSNHNVAACLSLSSLGIQRQKIIPWDWYYDMDIKFPVKCLTDKKSTIKMIYVGSVTYGKGVDEIIEAINYLNNRNLFLTVVGDGRNLEQFREKVRHYKLEQNISFLGKVENSKIMGLMRSHDIVIVPSRKKEAEGLPITIYEALTTKTPIICSNHPMFVFYLSDGVNASIFEESNYISLADSITKLAYSPTIYSKISANSYKTLEAIVCPVKIDEIIVNWLQRNNDWFKDKTLSALCAEDGQPSWSAASRARRWRHWRRTWPRTRPRPGRWNS